MIVYSLDQPHSLESVTTKWIPLVIEMGGEQKPIVVVGNKIDLEKNPSSMNCNTHLREHSKPILSQYSVCSSHSGVSVERGLLHRVQCQESFKPSSGILHHTANRRLSRRSPLRPQESVADAPLRPRSPPRLPSLRPRPGRSLERAGDERLPEDGLHDGADVPGDPDRPSRPPRSRSPHGSPGRHHRRRLPTTDATLPAERQTRVELGHAATAALRRRSALGGAAAEAESRAERRMSGVERVCDVFSASGRDLLWL